MKIEILKDCVGFGRDLKTGEILEADTKNRDFQLLSGAGFAREKKVFFPQKSKVKAKKK